MFLCTLCRCRGQRCLFSHGTRVTGAFRHLPQVLGNRCLSSSRQHALNSSASLWSHLSSRQSTLFRTGTFGFDMFCNESSEDTFERLPLEILGKWMKALKAVAGDRGGVKLIYTFACWDYPGSLWVNQSMCSFVSLPIFLPHLPLLSFHFPVTFPISSQSGLFDCCPGWPQFALLSSYLP